MVGLSTALAKSSVLHLILGVLLVYSMEFSPVTEQPKQLELPAIQAVVVDQQAIEQQVQRIEDNKRKQRLAEEKRIKELERRAEAAKKKRKQQEKAVSDLEKQKKRKLAEKRKADQAAKAARKKQQQEANKAKQAEALRKKKERERKAAEEKARKAKAKREAEEKALKEAKRKRQQAIEKAEQERALEEQLKAEQAVRQQRRSKQVLSEVQKYQVLIRQTIQRNLIVDDSMKGKSCRLNLRLASNGLVTQVRILEGDAILCRAAQTAVLKSDTLPVSSEPDVYEKLRDINLTVEPEL